MIHTERKATVVRKKDDKKEKAQTLQVGSEKVASVGVSMHMKAESKSTFPTLALVFQLAAWWPLKPSF
jgi:hypothetical protein